MKFFTVHFPFSILFSILLCTGLIYAQTAPTAPIPTKSREFSIPFEVRADNTADPVKEVELLYSQDRGVHWHSADRQAIKVGKFAYKAEADGEYWFAFRTVTLSGVTKQAGAASQIRVLVDAEPPKLSFTVTQQETGSLLVVWKAEDRNLQVKRPDFAVSVPADADKSVETAEKQWMPLNIDGRNVRTTESGLEGSFVFFPDGISDDVSEIELRASISDIAGNRAEKTNSVKINSVKNPPKPAQRHAEQLPDAPVAVSATPNAPVGSNMAASNVIETITYPNGSVPVTPPKPVRVRQQPQKSPPNPPPKTSNSSLPTMDQADESTVSPLPQPTLPLLISPDGKIAAVSTLGEPTPELVENKLAEELLANMGEFFSGALAVEASPIVKKPISKPEAAVPNKSPVTGGVAGSITGITLSTSGKQPQIVVKWNIGDAVWGDAQIDVFRGAAASGPWQPIEINLRNSGEYWWFLTPEDFKPFYIMVRIRSLHGGVRNDVTQSPIKINPESLR